MDVGITNYGRANGTIVDEVYISRSIVERSCENIREDPRLISTEKTFDSAPSGPARKIFSSPRIRSSAPYEKTFSSFMRKPQALLREDLELFSENTSSFLVEDLKFSRRRPRVLP